MTKSREIWYRNNTFWGSIGTTFALVLTAVAFLAKDLHWLLMIAWLFGCTAIWALVRSLFATRSEVWLATVMCSLLAGSALAYLNSLVKTDGNLPPSDNQARLEVRNAVVPTSRNGSPALNISFYNAGKFPATNVDHYYTLATAARTLSKKEATDIQDRALGLLKLVQSSGEIGPREAKDSLFTIPENPGEERTSDLLSRDLNHVLDGSRLM